MPRRTNTRERLIATASTLFRRQGYAQTGVNEIMKRARTTSGSFYHFFPTKDDLLLAVVDAEGELLDSEFFTDTSTDRDPMERIFAVFDARRRHLETTGILGSPLGTLAAELSESHPEIRRRIDQLYRGWVQRMQGRLEDAETRIPAGFHPRSLAEFLLDTIEGACLRARVSRSLSPFDETVVIVKRLLTETGKRADAGPQLKLPPRPASRSDTTSKDWRAW